MNNNARYDRSTNFLELEVNVPRTIGILRNGAYGTLRNETKRNEMVFWETVYCEMVLCETVFCEMALKFSLIGKWEDFTWGANHSTSEVVCVCVCVCVCVGGGVDLRYPLTLNEFFLLGYVIARYFFLPPTFCMKSLCVYVDGVGKVGLNYKSQL